MVANATTADVAWMVTDSIDYLSSFVEPSSSNDTQKNDPILVRTITIRGFDASDETVDRERLLIEICNSPGIPIDADAAPSNVLFHSGLLGIATAIYNDIKQYIDWTTPNHRLVLNGHSIGGSLSVLVLFLLTLDKGVDWVNDRVLRVYTQGSPPVAELIDTPVLEPQTTKRKTKQAPSTLFSSSTQKSNDPTHCQILEAFGLPSSMVYGYVQPYVRHLYNSN